MTEERDDDTETNNPFALEDPSKRARWALDDAADDGDDATRLAFRTDADELTAITLRWLRRQGAASEYLWSSLVAALWSGILVFIVLRIGTPFFAVEEPLSTALIALGAAALLYPLTYFRILRRVKRKVRQSVLQRLDDQEEVDYEVVFAPEHVAHRSEFVETRFRWPVLTAWRTDRHGLEVDFGKHGQVWIPLRAFPDAATRERVENLLTEQAERLGLDD